MSVFGWLNDQLLRMTWLNDLVGAGVAAVGLDPASRIGGSVQFFVYDVSTAAQKSAMAAAQNQASW